MGKIELLAPAGDLERLKTAILFGADAVYIGGKKLSLRSRAGNFTIAEIAEGVRFANEHGAKVYVTVNMIPHNEDLVDVEQYLRQLSEIGVSAIICASLHILQISKKVDSKMEVHISTQQTITNSSTIEYWKQMGADRVVLAREMSMKDIETTAKVSSLPIEVFIHGGMCVNYSGSCTLSNWMTLRDANRGGCAQSCRWKYRLYDGNNKEAFDESCLFSMSSKDMQAASYISKLIEGGISSLKIEGRMKTAYYIATVVSAYRKLIDEYYETGDISNEKIFDCIRKLQRAENRPTSNGFYTGLPNKKGHLYGINGAGVNQDFCAVVQDYDEKNKRALIQVRNYFEIKVKFAILSPFIAEDNFVVEMIQNEDEDFIEVANKPMELLHINMPVRVFPGDMLFRVSEDLT